MTVIAAHQEDQSSPQDNHYVWSCCIILENNGESPAQVVGRYWRITDAEGRIEEIFGPGLLGAGTEDKAMKLIIPGSVYEFTTEVHLVTSSGFMEGSYAIKTSKGEVVNISIPAVSLDMPGSVTLH